MLSFLRYHRRLFYAITVGLVAFVLLSEIPHYFRLAASWDAGAVFYIGYVFMVMRKCDPDALNKEARKLDVRGFVLFTLMIIAAFSSLYFTLSLLHRIHDAQGLEHNLGIALAAFTVVCSWLFVQVMFAVHYTHHYYAHDKDNSDHEGEGGLLFPKDYAGSDEAPDFWDFLYFSCVLGMTFQVSDVQVTRKHMRHHALIHGIVGFFFNTFILALIINIAAGLFEQ